jgi:pimeloyl-[acyl-carrier protein] methyl ester esterase
MSVSLYAEESGEGELPLVCLHGWGMNLRVFDPIRTAVEPVGLPTWAMDLPGHGQSSWNPARADFSSQLQDVLSSLPQRCVLLGWSLGGQFALEIARVAPARVAGLVLVASTPRFGKTDDWEAGLEPVAFNTFRQTLARDWLQTLGDFIWLQLRGSRNAETTQQQMLQALKEHGTPQREALVAGLELLATNDLRRHVANITHPVLLIAGQNDHIAPPAASQWMAQRMPRAKFLEIDRCGHAPFLSHVEECAQPLREFLADVGGVGA